MSTPTAQGQPTTPDPARSCTCDCCADQETSPTTVAACDADAAACGADCTCAA